MLNSNKIQTSFSQILSSGKDRYKYFKYLNILKKNNITERQVLILATITKTATHYMRVLIANYIKLLDCQQCKPVGPNEIDEMFPNGWHTMYQDRRKMVKPTSMLGNLNLVDIPRSHIPFQYIAWKNSRVLHTYRNPLDFSVFLYIFKYEFYADSAGKYRSPAHLLEAHLDSYMAEYLSFKAASTSVKNNVLSLSYEHLSLYPDISLNVFLRWIGFEPNPNLVKKAIKYTSERETAVIGAGEAWQRNNTESVNPELIENFTKKCLTQGSIGLWKDYYNPDEIAFFEKKILEYDVELRDFILSA